MRIVMLCFLSCLSMVQPTDLSETEFCGLKNTAYQSGESANYHVYYTLAGFFVFGGEANFNVNTVKLNGQIVHHIIAEGKTNNFFDGFFKVRDRYESYIDTASMQPLRFFRSIQEGSFKKNEVVTFNLAENTATSQKGTFKVPQCVQDVISSVYYARNIDFNKYKTGDKIPFSMFIDDEVFNIYIRYLGKEIIKTKYGKFRAIKFRPLLLKGEIFKGGETMTVWASDDANRIPVRIESSISVGSIKVDLMGHRALRNPLSSLIRQR